MKHEIKPESVEIDLRCLHSSCKASTATVSLKDMGERNITCVMCGSDMDIVAARTDTPRVIAFIEGGVIHDVMADAPMQLRIVDYDIEGSEDFVTIRLVEEDNKLSQEEQVVFVHKYDLKGVEDLTPFFNQDGIA